MSNLPSHFSGLVDKCARLIKSIPKEERSMPYRVTIPMEDTDCGISPVAHFETNQNYFQVRLNEMYLSYERQWFTTFDPMVLVISEFTYDGEKHTVPFTVGASMLENVDKIPEGMIFSDTRVAGIHPFRGGKLAISVILYRVKVNDYARNLLNIVGRTAGALDVGANLMNYTKIAGAVLDGVEAVLGLADTTPIVGIRREYDSNAGKVQPAFFALIDMSEQELNLQPGEKFWVQQNQLVCGNSLAAATPFRKADFALFSLCQVEERDDIDTLSFYPLWERIGREAMRPTADDWLSTKANWTTLAQDIMFSPDLTDKHADKLVDRYFERLKNLHEMAIKQSHLGAKEAETFPEIEAIRSKSLEIFREETTTKVA
ncbi:MAG: hypothetical protein LAO78_27950 [Acidobacteriia bacterium]|nr:hypothetical protein [Terriglobia bacterium]